MFSFVLTQICDHLYRKVQVVSNELCRFLGLAFGTCIQPDRLVRTRKMLGELLGAFAPLCCQRPEPGRHARSHFRLGMTDQEEFTHTPSIHDRSCLREVTSHSTQEARRG